MIRDALKINFGDASMNNLAYTVEIHPKIKIF